MGRGPQDAEGGRSGLGEDEASDVGKLAADLIDQRLACGGIGLAVTLAVGKQRLKPFRGCSDQLLRTALEPIAAGRTSFRPAERDGFILDRIGRRSVAEGLDQPKGVAD